MTYLRRLLTVSSITIASIGLIVVAGSSPVQANGSGLGITGSPHDFSDGVVDGAAGDESWNYRGEICRTCHVPHDHSRNATLSAEGLLWNHALSANDGAYTLYDSDTLEAAPGQPDGTSKLCLGCHDGSVALNQFDSQAGSTPTTPVYIQDGATAGFRVPGLGTTGDDLSGTHPLSVVYDTGDAGLFDPASRTMADGTAVSDLLDGSNKVQCATCHDVHDSAEAVPGTHLLRQGTTAATGGASALCLTCHDK